MIQPEVGPEPESSLAGELLPYVYTWAGSRDASRGILIRDGSLENTYTHRPKRGKRARTLPRSRVVIHAVEREKHDLTALSVKEPFYFYFGRTAMSIRSVCDR